MPSPPHLPYSLTAFIRDLEQELAPEGIDVRQANANVGEIRLTAWYQGSGGQPLLVTLPRPPVSRTEAQAVANTIRAALKADAPRE